MTCLVVLRSFYAEMLYIIHILVKFTVCVWALQRLQCILYFSCILNLIDPCDQFSIAINNHIIELIPAS